MCEPLASALKDAVSFFYFYTRLGAINAKKPNRMNIPGRVNI